MKPNYVYERKNVEPNEKPNEIANSVYVANVRSECWYKKPNTLLNFY